MMQRALELAAKGRGQVSPGPLVGSVIVSEDGEIVGEGFYLYENVKHAETVALEQAGERARNGTAYVSLEPHAHQGRTPPCTDALIEAGIKRVFAPIEDPNPLVSGKGFLHLREAGIEVITGLLSKEAAQLNEKYNHAICHGRPFVHLKMACSLDGRIATKSGDARWITGEEARRRVHELRQEYDAILVGAGTATTDDPLLTDRSGIPRHRKLIRVILDKALQISPYSNLVRTAREYPLIVFTSEAADLKAIRTLEDQGVEVIRDLMGGRDLATVLEHLKERSIQSVLVEGGTMVAGSFLDAGLVDKVSFFIAPIIIGGYDAKLAVGGAGADRLSDVLRLSNVEYIPRGKDIEITGYPYRAERQEPCPE
jgi:diaminohydroxyphosphoribosylaminopyrimidine deaminase / 5-amino-6-(5-phosphoribosylamino)uracil reductase